jgi:hypothetical protein
LPPIFSAAQLTSRALMPSLSSGANCPAKLSSPGGMIFETSRVAATPVRPPSTAVPFTPPNIGLRRRRL